MLDKLTVLAPDSWWSSESCRSMGRTVSIAAAAAAAGRLSRSTIGKFRQVPGTIVKQVRSPWPGILAKSPLPYRPRFTVGRLRVSKVLVQGLWVLRPFAKGPSLFFSSFSTAGGCPALMPTSQ